MLWKLVKPSQSCQKRTWQSNKGKKALRKVHCFGELTRRHLSKNTRFTVGITTRLAAGIKHLPGEKGETVPADWGIAVLSPVHVPGSPLPFPFRKYSYVFSWSSLLLRQSLDSLQNNGRDNDLYLVLQHNRSTRTLDTIPNGRLYICSVKIDHIRQQLESMWNLESEMSVQN